MEVGQAADCIRIILIVTDFGEKALYADDQALFSYQFEI